MDEYYDAVSALPGVLAGPLSGLAPEKAARVHEVRLRAGAAPAFTVSGAPVSAAQLCPELPALCALRPGAAQLEEALVCLCGCSVHSFEDELAEGYLTLPGGHRVGVAGRYTLAGAGPAARYTLSQVTSLNLRVARCRVVALPPGLAETLRRPFGGILLAGEPDSGKTTLLRSFIPVLCAAHRVCTVADEREELCGRGTAGLAYLGAGADVLSGMSKADAVQRALRTLSPQVVLLDELGTVAEVAALRQGFFSGVDFVATLHASSAEDAARRPQFRLLRRWGMVRQLWVLAGREAPCTVREVKRFDA